MIHLQNVSKNFGQVKAVNDVSFLVGKGEVVGLLGPNGAGKTTTMRLITGFLSPCLGSINIAGEKVDGGNATKKMIGYLPENAPLYHDLDVREIINYFCKLRNVDPKSIPVRRNAVVKQCGLEKVYTRQVGTLSKGYKQRVGLALALVHEPEVLILDEPTSGLDPNQIIEIRRLISEIGRERTVLLSTHIMQEVEAMCNRAIIINEGRLAGVGTLDELKVGSSGAGAFEVCMNAPRAIIEDALSDLESFKFGEWITNVDSKRQRFTLLGPVKEGAGETIFNWAASSNLPLCELKSIAMSLEEVFRDLTDKEM